MNGPSNMASRCTYDTLGEYKTIVRRGLFIIIIIVTDEFKQGETDCLIAVCCFHNTSICFEAASFAIWAAEPAHSRSIMKYHGVPTGKVLAELPCVNLLHA